MVMDGDFGGFANHMVVPFTLVTASANLSVATLDDLQDGFDDFVSMLEDMNVTALLRKVIDAQFISGSMINGTYSTVHLCGDAVVVPEFYSRIWLRHIDGIWKATEIRNTTRNERWPIICHKVDSAAWPPKEAII